VSSVRVELTETTLTSIDDDEAGHDEFIEKILEVLMDKIIEAVRIHVADFPQEIFDQGSILRNSISAKKFSAHF
jgi:hypothetical protein